MQCGPPRANGPWHRARVCVWGAFAARGVTEPLRRQLPPGGRKLVLNRMVRVAPEHGAHTGGEHIGTVRRARGVVAAWQDGVGARVPFHQREMIRICRG